jgi:hypothetical protein
MASGVEAGAAPEVAFLRHGGIYRSDVFNTSYKPGPAYRFPVGSGPGPEARRKETRLLIVATSSGRLFLNGLLASIARLRFAGTCNLTCNFTSPGKRGHFYFASEATFLLCLDTEARKG